MKPPTVVNVRTEKYDVYIGRGSMYGNPFKIGVHGNRAEVIARYGAWVRTQGQILKSLKSLTGKRLGCYCKPQPCHGDVLVELWKKLVRNQHNWR